jgi:hypothetical protein
MSHLKVLSLYVMMVLGKEKADRTICEEKERTVTIEQTIKSEQKDIAESDKT